MLLAEGMLMTLFGYGQFTAVDAQMASYSLIAYSIGLPAFLLIKIFAPAFFSRQNTRTPVRIGIVALLSNMVYNLLFVLPMIWMDFIAPHTGLALASSLSAWQQAYMLYRELGRENIYQLSGSAAAFALKALPAMAVLTLVLWAGIGISWEDYDASGRLLRLLAIMAGSAAAYILVLLLSGIRPQQLANP